MNHFISLADLTPGTLRGLLKLSANLKDPHGRAAVGPVLTGQVLGMVFAKPSLRTRVSFDRAMLDLGGHGLYLSPNEIGLGQRESVADVARVLSRYVDGIMARVFSHAHIVELARHSTVPVVNGLSDYSHPCQGLADLLTLHENLGDLAGRHLAYVGDGNNVATSLLFGGALTGMRVTVVHPPGFAPAQDVMERAHGLATATGAHVEATTDLASVEGADALYTDVWASMGQEDEAAERRRLFAPYQLNRAVVDRAGSPIVLHCLPAHRGEEITDEVIDGPASRVFDQAENRLHAQRGLLAWLMGGVGLPAG